MKWIAVFAEAVLLVNVVFAIVACAEPVRHWFRDNVRIITKDDP